jgi:hypothetical protein
MADAGQADFDRLVEGFTLEQRAEFFKVLHLAGVTRQDIELARLLRVLQLYKSFYEEIPERIVEALGQADALGQRIQSLDERIASRLDSALTRLERNSQSASLTAAQFREARTVITTAIEKSTQDIAHTLDSVLRRSLAAGLLTPFESFLRDIRQECSQTAKEARQITVQLRQARRIHLGGYALAAAVMALVLTGVVWSNAARHYARREQQLIRQIDQNRQVLGELARKGAVLELQRDPKDSRKLYLLLERAKAWTTDKYAVVEVK